MAYIFSAMKLVPKNLLSFLLGVVVRLRLPDPLGQWLRQRFIRYFSIDMSEAEFGADEYGCIEDIFTRKLKPGSRPISGAVAAPADGFLAQSGPSRQDRAIQVKGMNYSLEELVFGVKGPCDREFSPAWFTTVYLAPHNYHRVHAPVGGRLVRIRYIPGELWPVNRQFVGIVPNLFARNERMVFEIVNDDQGRVDVVMVGALNVGRIATSFLPNLCSNSISRLIDSGVQEFSLPVGTGVAVGDELGTFLLGSTVVMVFDKKFVESFKLVENSGDNIAIKMGASLLS